MTHQQNDQPGGPEQAAEYEAVEEQHLETEGQELGQDDAAAEASQLREALLRTRAEMDNLRKRTERELEKSRRFINEALMKDLVPVLDTLDQGVENAGGQQVLQEGLMLVRKQLVQSLERHGLAVIDPLGEAFDPDWHEAMSLQPSADHPADSIMLVLQRGYTLNDRLLRPARVIVARPADH